MNWTVARQCEHPGEALRYTYKGFLPQNPLFAGNLSLSIVTKSTCAPESMMIQSASSTFVLIRHKVV
jgi:hypothetical protein